MGKGKAGEVHKATTTGLNKRAWLHKLCVNAQKHAEKGRESNPVDAPQKGNPLLPNDAIGSLSDFGVSEPRESNVVEQVSEGTSPLKYLIWIFALLTAVGVFYGIVFAASGSLSNFLKDKVTFTQKDFIPYSERRRMQEELALKHHGEPTEKSDTDNNKEERQNIYSNSNVINLLPGQ